MELIDFKNKHSREKLIVMGIGASLLQYHLSDYLDYITIGVNDIEKYDVFPNYIVFLDNFSEIQGPESRRRQFRGTLENSKSTAMFFYRKKSIDMMSSITQNKIIDISSIRKYDGSINDTYNKNNIYHYMMSPFVGLTLALYMGAKTVGLIGVDFADPTHALYKYREAIDNKLLVLRIQNPDVKFYNLSSHSTITAFNKLNLEDF